MPMPADELEALIKAALPDADIVITDLAGDSDHYRAEVTSTVFKGLSRIEQHKLVYGALGERMGTELHALSLKTVIKE